MAVEEWVNGKDPDFFSSGLMTLEHHWSKCITLEGNYIEKKKRWISTGNKLGWLLIDSTSYFCCKNVSSFCNAKATHIFSAKNIYVFAIFQDRNFNVTSANNFIKV